MLERAGLGEMAAGQLAAWEQIAARWPLYVDRSGTHQRCERCSQSVIRLLDQHGKPYQYTSELRLALIVAHLRQAHPDLDPDHG